MVVRDPAFSLWRRRDGLLVSAHHVGRTGNPRFVRAQTIVNTWPFVDATAAAWDVVRKGGSAVDAVLEVCVYLHHSAHPLTSSVRAALGRAYRTVVYVVYGYVLIRW